MIAEIWQFCSGIGGGHSAQPPAIGRMMLVAGKPDDPPVLDVEHDAAIGTDTFDGLDYAHSRPPFSGRPKRDGNRR